jgi:hypothetical protein
LTKTKKQPTDRQTEMCGIDWLVGLLTQHASQPFRTAAHNALAHHAAQTHRHTQNTKHHT